jgi:hypothetical protein
LASAKSGMIANETGRCSAVLETEERRPSPRSPRPLSSWSASCCAPARQHETIAGLAAAEIRHHVADARGELVGVDA